MPQLSLYVDEGTMETLRVSARVEGVSMSKYAAGLIRDRSQHGGWPQGYWDAVYGCLDDGLGLCVSDADLHPEFDDPCDWLE